MEINTEIPLVGREREVGILLELRRQILQPVCSGTRTIIVHGSSGSGKTALCHQVLLMNADKEDSKQPQQQHVFSVEGKFDQYTDYASPYSALVEAFDSLGRQALAAKNGNGPSKNGTSGSSRSLLDGDGSLIGTLQQCLSLEGGLILAQLIPSFQDILNLPKHKPIQPINTSTTTATIKDDNKFNRINRFANRKLPSRSQTEDGLLSKVTTASEHNNDNDHGSQPTPYNLADESSSDSDFAGADNHNQNEDDAAILAYIASKNPKVTPTPPTSTSNNNNSNNNNNSLESTLSPPRLAAVSSLQLLMDDSANEQTIPNSNHSERQPPTLALLRPIQKDSSSFMDDSDSKSNAEFERANMPLPPGQLQKKSFLIDSDSDDDHDEPALPMPSLLFSGDVPQRQVPTTLPPSILKKGSLIDSDSDDTEPARQSPLPMPSLFTGNIPQHQVPILTQQQPISILKKSSLLDSDSDEDEPSAGPLPPSLIPQQLPFSDDCASSMPRADGLPRIRNNREANGSGSSSPLTMPGLVARKSAGLLIDSDSEQEADAEQAELEAAMRVSMLYHQQKEQKKQQQLASREITRQWSKERLKPIDDTEVVPPPPPLIGQQTFFQKTSERLAVAFGVFLTKFCSQERPLILFMDDVQWADQNSSDLLALLANDSIISNLLIVACFRDEKEENPETMNPRQLFKSQLFFTGEVPELYIGNLALEGVQNMIAKSLRLSDDDENMRLAGLASIVFRKTLGSPYFVMQFLQLLVREKLLFYNFANFRWQWDESLLQDMDVSDNVVSVVLKRMESLPPPVQRLLALAAFVGFYMSMDLLEELSHKEDILECLPFSDSTSGRGDSNGEESSATNPSLNSSPPPIAPPALEVRNMFRDAQKEGFVEIIGDVFKFCHDKVQETAYGLVAKESIRIQLHWKIGHIVHDVFVRQNAFRYGDRFVFLAADQLNRGSSDIKADQQRLELIKLNWHASKVAGNKSSLDLMAEFLLKAIALTREPDWRSDNTTYNLLLEIFTRAVEVEASRGNLAKSQQIATVVLQHIQKPEDGRGAKIAKSHAYGWSMQWNLAIKEAREVLTLCGETLAPSTLKAVQKQFHIIKGLVKGKSDFELLNLHAMTDDLKISGMKMLKFGIPFGFAVDEHFANLCLLKMMELTLRYGHLSETGGFALSGFGCVLANMSDDKKEAYRFSQLALKVSGDKASNPGTALNVYCYLSHIKQPTGGSLEPTLGAYRTGLEVGDMAFGGYCMSLYAQLYIINGLPLQSYKKDMKKISGQLKLFQQDFCNLYVVQGLQLSSNLSEESDEKLFPMTWEGIAQHGCFPKGMDIPQLTKGQPPQSSLLYLDVFQKYIMNDWEGVRLGMKKVFAMKPRQFPGYHFGNFFFNLIEGLSGVILFKTFKKRKYKVQAKRATERLQSSAEDGSSDACLFLQLLQSVMATIAWPRAPASAVKKKLDAAIAQLSRSGFLHFAAIANERLSEFMSSQKDADYAEFYIQKASLLYFEWGAHRKVKALKKAYTFLDVSRSSSGRGMALRGRSRSGSLMKPQSSVRNLQKAMVVGAGVVESSSISPSVPFSASSSQSLGCYSAEV